MGFHAAWRQVLPKMPRCCCNQGYRCSHFVLLKSGVPLAGIPAADTPWSSTAAGFRRRRTQRPAVVLSASYELSAGHVYVVAGGLCGLGLIILVRRIDFENHWSVCSHDGGILEGSGRIRSLGRPVEASPRPWKYRPNDVLVISPPVGFRSGGTSAPLTARRHHRRFQRQQLS